MPNTWGQLSGYDIRMRVDQRFGLSSGIITESGNRLSANEDDLFKGNAIEDCINNELNSWWMKINEVNADRIATYHDFTHPADTESVSLRQGMGAQRAVMSPPLPRPWLDLRTLENRATDRSPWTVPFVQFEQYLTRGGWRWSYHSDMLYVADTGSTTGIGTATAMRLHYVPVALPLNTLSTVVRTDIPNEIANVLVLGSVLRCLGLARVRPDDPQYQRLSAEYREESSLALKSVTKTTTRSHTLEWTERPMMEVW